MKPLYAIDSSVYIFRSYFALEPRWQSRDGRPTETVYGFAAFLLRFLAAESPRFVGAAFDESLGSGFRHRLDPQYKANRALPDDDLAFQLGACRQVAQALGIATFACDEYEADDYLATMAALAHPGQAVYLLSRDKDLAQLLSDDISLWDYGYSDPLSRLAYLEARGLEPALVADYLALVGDSSDNIAGVPGIGAKTATAILNALGPVARWLDAPEKLATVNIRGSRRLAEKISAHREQLLLARQLTGLRVNPAGPNRLEQLRWQGIDLDAATALFDTLGIGGLQKRLQAVAVAA